MSRSQPPEPDGRVLSFEDELQIADGIAFIPHLQESINMVSFITALGGCSCSREQLNTIAVGYVRAEGYFGDENLVLYESRVFSRK